MPKTRKLVPVTINFEKEVPSVKIDKIRSGLKSYQSIMGEPDNSDKFKKIFAKFYGLNAGMPSNDKDVYFKEMFKHKDKDGLKNPKEFAEQLMTAGATKFYFSFATKAVHTFNPDSPIYDSHVLVYLKAKEELCGELRLTRILCKDEAATKRERERVLKNWEIIQEWYSRFEESGRCKGWIKWFDKKFRDELKIREISKTKKIDFILYALGVE